MNDFRLQQIVLFYLLQRDRYPESLSLLNNKVYTGAIEEFERRQNVHHDSTHCACWDCWTEPTAF